jgi:hypothetical protein
MSEYYTGTNNADDTLVTPWFIRGWTAQAIPADTVQAPGPAVGLGEPEPFPTALEFIQVTAPYFDMDGNPLSGFLTFLMSDSITVTSGGFTYRMPARYAGRDNTATPGGYNNWGYGRIYIRRGLMSVSLFATNNASITTDSGNPLTYHVVEHMLGGQQYDITVSDLLTSPADLRSLIVNGTVAAYQFDPASPAGNEGYLPLTTALADTPFTDIYPTDIDGGNA